MSYFSECSNCNETGMLCKEGWCKSCCSESHHWEDDALQGLGENNE